MIAVPRRLSAYPDAALRRRSLAVVVVSTIACYYAVYVKGAVAPLVISEYDMSLAFYIGVSIAGNLCGAFAALASGVVDRIGRTGLVLRGMVAVTILTGVVLPHAGSKVWFLLADVLQTTIVGAVLVATPALIRDFAPQLGRATAMCTWNLGPILGSLLVSTVASRTLDDHPDWRFQYYVCAAVVAVVLVVAALGLRELAPELRAQLVVSGRDRAAVDAAAREGVTPDLDWRRLVTPRIVLPAIGISLFLFFYVTRLAYWVIFFVTTHGFTPAQANGLSNWWWATSALCLPVIGVVSDRLGVRKPILLAGALGSAAALGLFATLSTEPGTSYATFVLLVVPAAAFGVATYGMWLTAFSQAIESIEPALVATGMAIYGWIVRILVAVALVSVLALVGAASTLVDHGAEVSRISTTYAQQIGKLDAPRPAVARRAARQIPAADLDYLREHGQDVATAVQEGPRQWRTWWRICLLGQLALVPTIWLLPGPWRRRRGAAPDRA